MLSVIRQDFEVVKEGRIFYFLSGYRRFSLYLFNSSKSESEKLRFEPGQINPEYKPLTKSKPSL
jgi:hypothetical protein